MNSVRSSRYKSLDVWRGVACLTVVIYHTAQLVERRFEGDTAVVYSLLRYGYLGVPLFFVISGYCISAAVESHRRSNRPGWTFIWRRARRIYPPFWASTGLLVLAIVTAKACGIVGFSRLHEALGELRPLQWLSGLSLTHTWTHGLFGTWRWPHAVTWSLCYEEQFYFICFVTLVVVPTRFFQSMLGVTLLVTAAWLTAAALGLQGRLYGTFFYFGWWQFACGVGVYWRLNCVERAEMARSVDRLVWPTALVLLVISAVMARRPVAFESFFVNPWLGLCTAIVFSLLLLALREFDGRLIASPIGSLLGNVGVYSYSLYLTHVPVCMLIYRLMYRTGCWTPTRALVLTIPAAVAASLLAAWMFHRLVERRFLNPPGEAARKCERPHADTSLARQRPVPAPAAHERPDEVLATI